MPSLHAQLHDHDGVLGRVVRVEHAHDVRVAQGLHYVQLAHDVRRIVAGEREVPRLVDDLRKVRGSHHRRSAGDAALPTFTATRSPPSRSFASHTVPNEPRPSCFVNS